MADHTTSPWYIAPLLVEQPTWGGQYIARAKSLTDPHLLSRNIGQAFELFDGTQVTQTPQRTDSYTYFTASATNLKEQQRRGRGKTKPLQSLIAADPASILGQRYQAVHQNSLNTLIKFTQALNNSYQVHVKPGHEFGHWQAKPESWYYFEPGIITLGLVPNCDVAAYHRRSQEIDDYAHSLSHAVNQGKLKTETARTQLDAFIQQDHPRRFVNTVEVQADQVVDLSECGIHHSWEIGPSAPQGNIVYEVQVDVKDDFCTLRSFDQGKMKDDGSVRPLSIDDYFKALDPDPQFNHPARFFRPAPASKRGSLIPVFQTPAYRMDLVNLDANESIEVKQDYCFHHLFVKEGLVTLLTGTNEYLMEPGWSLFVPAVVRHYRLRASQESRVLVTSI